MGVIPVLLSAVRHAPVLSYRAEPENHLLPGRKSRSDLHPARAGGDDHRLCPVFLGPFTVHYGTTAKGDTDLAEKGLSMADTYDDVVWMCPKCNDRGFISNWQGTIWDMSEMGEVEH